MTTPPHYIPYGEPLAKREESTQVTGQLVYHLAILLSGSKLPAAAVITPFTHDDSIDSCLLSAREVLHMQNLVVR